MSDCLPLATLVLRDDYKLVTLGSLRQGERIMGDGEWALVQETSTSGEKAVLAISLANGCVLRCSPDHKLFREGARDVEEVRAADVTVGDDLITPSVIARTLSLAADADVYAEINARMSSPLHDAAAALQLRLLHRMIGVATKNFEDGHVAPLVGPASTRVIATVTAGVELCGDIKTDSGKFWLPESDVLVHNREAAT